MDMDTYIPTELQDINLVLDIVQARLAEIPLGRSNVYEELCKRYKRQYNAQKQASRRKRKALRLSGTEKPPQGNSALYELIGILNCPAPNFIDNQVPH